MKKNQKQFEYQKILEKAPALFQISKACLNTCQEKGIAGQNTGYILAPAVYCFTGWVLRKAQSQGIRRLYFLARDGYQFYQCAVRLCREWQLHLECRYLECSRYSLRIPMFVKLGEQALDYICLGGMDVTFRKVMQRAGIGGKEAVQIGEISGFLERMDEPMSYQQVQSLKAVLRDCKPFMERMQEISKQAYPLAEAYLRQEGLFEDTTYAVVDSGWTGSMQKVLQQLLAAGGCTKELQGFYWGLYELPEEMNPKCYDAYYFKVKGDYRRKVYFSNCLFEAIFSAPHGMTVAYEKRGDRMESRYDVEVGSNSERIERQTQVLLSGADKAAKELKNWSEKEYVQAAEIIYKLFRSFMGHPSKEEAQWYGSYRFSDDVLEEQQQTVAADLSRKELRDNHVLHKFLKMYGFKKGAVRESAWYEASAVLGEGSSRWHQKQYQWYKYLIYIRKNIKK